MNPGARGFSVRTVLAGLLIPLLVVTAYWPGLGGGFAFDDWPNIIDNHALHVGNLNADAWAAAAFSSPSSDLQRPLAMLSFAANHYLSGLDPVPMKATNIALHALNALLALMLARRVLRVALGHPGVGHAAWLVAALWALHPINQTAVLYVVQRMEILAHSFVFLGLIGYFEGRARQVEGRPGWLPIVTGLVACTFAGALAKESAVLLPLYAFLAELLIFRFGGESNGRPLRPRLAALFLVLLFLPAAGALAWLLPRSLSPDAYVGRDFTLSERLLTEPRVVLDYLRWMFLPDLSQLALQHDDYSPSRGVFSPWTTAACLVLAPALAGLAWWGRKFWPVPALGVLWFFSAHLLTASFIPLELMFEHRNYFASFGICLSICWFATLAPLSARWRAVGFCLAGSFVLLLGALTHLRAREWSDPVRFISSEAAKHPNSPRATYDLARILIVLGNYDPQSPHTLAAWPAIERARAAPGSGLMPEQAALMLAARTGVPQGEEWWSAMIAKARARPLRVQDISAVSSLVQCAVSKACDFPRDRMLELFAAASSHGRIAEIENLSASYHWSVLGMREEALESWRQAIRLSPGQAQYRVNLGRALAAVGRAEEARAQAGALRRMGRFGQHERAAESIDEVLAGRVR